MNILFLSNNPPISSPLADRLSELGETVLWWPEKVTPDLLYAHHVDFVISYNYVHMVREDVLSLLPGRIVNLHISYLPWNRGADPNIWSYLDGTPSGVTIHLMEKGLDTGDILVQRKVPVALETETLRSSYEKLHQEIQRLFLAHWDRMKAGALVPVRQQGRGSMHYKKDLDPFRASIDYDVPISRFLAAFRGQDK